MHFFYNEWRKFYVHPSLKLRFVRAAYALIWFSDKYFALCQIQQWTLCLTWRKKRFGWLKWDKIVAATWPDSTISEIANFLDVSLTRMYRVFEGWHLSQKMSSEKWNCGRKSLGKNSFTKWLKHILYCNRRVITQQNAAQHNSEPSQCELSRCILHRI